MEIKLNKVIPNPLLETNFADSQIWDQADVKFRTGDFFLIKAPSGKGKSSLAAFIFGLRFDYQGDIFINNKNIIDFKDEELQNLRKDDFSIVFQGLNLFDNLTAYENIELKNDITNHKSHEEILKMASDLDIEHLLNKAVKTLSFGQKQRVAIIRALCQNFKLLILDEAFSHLDKKNIEICWSLIKSEAQKNNSIVLINSLGENSFPEITKTINL